MSSIRNSYSVEHKIQVLKWHKENGGNLRRTSRMFGMDRKSIRSWLQTEDILNANNFGSRRYKHKIGSGQKPLSIELDEELYEFFKNESENGRSVRNKILREESRRIASKIGLINFKGSGQYITRFKRRYNISNNLDSIDSQEEETPSYFEEVDDTIKIEMDKDSKKKNRKDAINITKIYETIKDKGFIQDLWLDVMSDLKEKPSYARLKNMVEKVIESAVDNYATKPKDHEERLKTRTIFTDLSIMTFTIDTLISELLHKKLKDEFKTIIGNIVEDLKNKDLQPKEESNVDNMLENVEEDVCNGTAEKAENKVTKGSKTSSTSKLPNKRIPAADDLHVDNLRKDLRSKTGEHSIDIFNSNTVALSIVETEPEENSNTIINKPKLKNLSSVKNGKRKLPTKFSKRRKAASNNSDTSSEENYDLDIVNVSDDDAVCFDGDCSISSVSSVHTSDLSSFEDDVSISSEDEKGRKTKKFVPLHLAKEYFNKNSFDKLKKRGKKKIKLQNSKDYESSKFSKDSPNKRLSGRTRKPNSKYSSEDMLCTLRLIPHADSSTSEKSEEDIPKEVFNIPKSENSLAPIVKKETRGRPRKSIPYHIKKFDQASEDSSDSDVSSKDTVNKKDVLQIKKYVEIPKPSPRKGRPPKNRTSENTVLGHNHQETVQNNQGNMKCNFTVPRPYISGTENGTHILFKHKRGRPSKADLAMRNEILARSIVLDSSLSVSKQSSPNNQRKPNSSKSEHDSTRKKETIIPDTNAEKTDDVPFKHSVESFSILEESLCLKDKQINQQNSPSKNSTKSYQASDLYKPRSDFRVSFNSRGSKAMTLFSN